MSNEERNVFAHSPQWWHGDMDYFQAIIEISPESSIGHLSLGPYWLLRSRAHRPELIGVLLHVQPHAPVTPVEVSPEHSRSGHQVHLGIMCRDGPIRSSRCDARHLWPLPVQCQKARSQANLLAVLHSSLPQMGCGPVGPCNATPAQLTPFPFRSR